MRKFYLFLILFFVFVASGCVQLQNNYGMIKMIPPAGGKVTIQDLIDKWQDYNVYYYDDYDGYSTRTPLGIMFDPKNNDTTLVGDRWKKVKTQQDLIEMTKWIFPTTQYEPWLNEILGPHGRFYGYLYYSYGGVVLKKIGDNKIYVFALEKPIDEGLGTEMH
jgi:hypothetical protein